MARLLITDDNQPSRSFTVAQARHAGHQVVEASSGREALERFHRERFDVVLLDVLMPELDGVATCRLLRTAPGGLDVPVLFVTGLDDGETIDAVIDAGGDDVLVKPFRGAELAARVRSLLRMYEVRRAEHAATTLAIRQREELERMAAQKDALAEFLVHDLKSPLASVAFTIHELLAQPVPEHAREPLQSCLSATEIANRMVMNLLDLDGSGRLHVQAASCPVPTLLDHVRATFAIRLAVRGVELVCHTAVDEVWADRELLRRTAENLVDNALRYAPSGSWVEVALAGDRDGTILEVTDHGPGVPPAEQERVFDRFVQLDPDATRASRGLGLAFCRLAVEAHQGKIWVEDAPGGGARFRAFFPNPERPAC